MANTLGTYDPIFYAQEALIHLENALGLATRVHRGFEEERNVVSKGSTININRPSVFSVEDAPSSAQDLAPETIPIVVDRWKEVKFKLSDKELAFTQEKIITDHIRPAAYAIADFMDADLADLHQDIPWFYDLAATPAVDDITGTRAVMFENAVPLRDFTNMHYMIDGSLEAGFLNLTAFTQQQGAGDLGVNSQMSGSLGTKFGLELFANQNVASHTKGTADDPDLLLNGGVAKGASTLSADAVSLAGTVVPGDTFVIAGSTQRYAVTNTVKASGNELAGITFTPIALIAYSDGDALTLSLDDHVANIAFHRNAFALVMAPLGDLANNLGANVAQVQDPVTGLSIRSRMYYVGDSSEVHVALDVLYGVKTLDPNLAAIGRG